MSIFDKDQFDEFKSTLIIGDIFEFVKGGYYELKPGNLYILEGKINFPIGNQIVFVIGRVDDTIFQTNLRFDSFSVMKDKILKIYRRSNVSLFLDPDLFEI